MKRWLLKLVDALRRRERGLFVVGAVATGLAMGAAAAAFRFIIVSSHALLFSGADGHGGGATGLGMAVMALLPAIGSLIVGLLVYKVLKLKGGHGVPSVMKAIATGQVHLSPRMAIKSGTAAITISSGGSCGPEGPIMEIGAVVGSVFGTRLGLTREHTGTLIGCGTAAGIAAMFDAPIGGVFLAMELILRDFAIRSFGPVVLAAIVASVSTEALFPSNPVFPSLAAVLESPILDSIRMDLMQVVMFCGMGAVCGLFGILMIVTLYRMHDAFQRLRLPMWSKPALGGLGVGLVALAFPTVIGEGYSFVNEAILSPFTTGQEVTAVLALQFLLVAGLKILVTSLTLGSGGTGGSFAPAMVTGAMVGAGVGVLCNHVAPGVSPGVPVFALAGMAALVTSALGIPIAGFLIIYEVTGADYRLVLPLMLTVATSAVVSNAFHRGTVYTLSLLRDGFDVEEEVRKSAQPLAQLEVSSLMTRHFTTVAPGDNLNRLIDVFVGSSDDAFIVTDDEGKLYGTVSARILRSVLNQADIGEAIIAADAAEFTTPVLMPGSMASEALRIFGDDRAEIIPVIESAECPRVVGVIRRVDVFAAFRKSADAQRDER